MSRQFRQYLPVMKKIERMKDTQRRNFLKECDKALIECFGECAQNVLKQRSAEKTPV